VHRHDADSLEVSPIDKDTFIYTYTLRPRSLLDNYRPSDPVTERMKFEDSPNDDR
jgi:hypothetical protein